jgi:hypothetical protein
LAAESGTQLNPSRRSLVWFVHRNPDQRRAVVTSPTDVAGRLAPTGQSLVRVSPLVGYRGDFGGMSEQAGDEVAPNLRQMVFCAGVIEGVGITFEERHMCVHARSRMFGEGLGHKRGGDALGQRNLLDNHPKSHQVVLLQHGDRAAPEVSAQALWCVVEVAGLIHRNRRLARLHRVFEEEELHLWMGVEGKSEISGLLERPLQHISGVGI